MGLERVKQTAGDEPIFTAARDYSPKLRHGIG
jgi:hypothetical protein